MKLKGLVWFFTIFLIVISIWELSYTFAVRSYRNKMNAQAQKEIKSQYPNISADSLDLMTKKRAKQLLDSTRDKVIYLGSTYQKCLQNELNLGLDLQGGLSFTLDVSLETLVKNQSKYPNDPALLAAIKTANQQKENSSDDFITLFTNAYIKANPGKLASLYSGKMNGIKSNDTDEKVSAELKKVGQEAIKRTYEILLKRIDKFGVAQPNVNLDENKGVINVELAGASEDRDRIRTLLQSSANLQFWEMYMPQEIFQEYVYADSMLYLSMNPNDVVKKNNNPLISLSKLQVTSPSSNAAIGYVALKDTGKFNNYINNPIVMNAMRSDARILYGAEEKDEKTKVRYCPIYVIKKQKGTDKAKLEGDGVAEASQSFDQRNKPCIKMEMTDIGSKTWAKMTTDNVGRPIAISLDDIIYSAPNVNQAITGGSSEITGNFTIEEAQDLANILKSGKLDAPAKIVAEQYVGSTLGKEAQNGGIMSFIIAFAVIVFLMLIYYNTGGTVAIIALIFNLLFTVGVLTSLGFTLTAAGIAGLVLTIGMAVDTNVIIFERIKEELNRGKSYPVAVDEGYKRSLAPVIDAHVTSLLTAFILFYFGLGPVLGFATTQIIGILLSLFCGILFSRLITELWTKKQRHFNYFTALSKRLFKNAKYKFIEYRKVAYVISALVLTAGIASFFVGFHQGVEFKGGRSYTIQFDKKVTSDEALRNSLKQALEGDNVSIKTVGEDGKQLNITTSYLKGQDKADSAVLSRLMIGLKPLLPQDITYAKFTEKSKYIQSSVTIQPSISDDLKAGAVKATIFAMLIIFLYIFFRFRDWRYSAGTILTLLHDVLVTLAVFAFFKNIVPFPLEIDQHFIAAILTVIGFSMNDTVIVFDRIREYSRDMKGESKTTIINKAINDTLSRTIMTSLTVFLTILILFIFGGEVTRGFAFAMLIGVVTGTYSSIFVGAPILVDFAKNKPLGAAKEKRKKVQAPEL
jgi:SecD/SecF fusion protein